MFLFGGYDGDRDRGVVVLCPRLRIGEVLTQLLLVNGAGLVSQAAGHNLSL